MSTWYEWRDAPPADYAVIGDPIAHSWSPKLHQAAYRALGLDERYEAIRVPPDEFEAALAHLASLGFRGVNVTIPLKEAAFAWVHSVDAESSPYRALNTLSLSDGRGTNTDAPGFLDMLAYLDFPNPSQGVRDKFTATKERVTQGESYLEAAQEILATPQGPAPRTQEVLASAQGVSRPRPLTLWSREWKGEMGQTLILGAGSTARTLAIALQNRGFKVAIWNRTRQRAEDLAREVPGLVVLQEPMVHGCLLIVNATAAGLSGESPQVIWSGVEPNALAIDAVYAKEPTPFMRAAREHGLKAVDGRLMLVAQAARSFAWWHGSEMPYEAMLSVVMQRT